MGRSRTPSDASCNRTALLPAARAQSLRRHATRTPGAAVDGSRARATRNEHTCDQLSPSAGSAPQSRSTCSACCCASQLVSWFTTSTASSCFLARRVSCTAIVFMQCVRLSTVARVEPSALCHCSSAAGCSRHEGRSTAHTLSTTSSFSGGLLRAADAWQSRSSSASTQSSARTSCAASRTRTQSTLSKSARTGGDRGERWLLGSVMSGLDSRA